MNDVLRIASSILLPKPMSSIKGAANDRPTHQKCVLNVKLAEALYITIEKPADMLEEEWAMWISPDVRRFIAFHLGVEFTTFKEMVETKKKGEPQAPALEAER